MVAIRQACETDRVAAQFVADMAFRTARKTYRPTSLAIQAKASIKGELKRLVAVDDDELIGTVQYRLIEDRLHLLGLAVMPNWQRRGIAGRFVEALITLAKCHVCRVISLYTIKQTGNVAIFERLGFMVISESIDTLSESVAGDLLTEVFMEMTVEQYPHSAHEKAE